MLDRSRQFESKNAFPLVLKESTANKHHLLEFALNYFAALAF